MFRHPDTPGKTPRLSKSKAKALRRKDRFPKLPLLITLRETAIVIRLHWQELLALSWLILAIYTTSSFCFALLLRWFAVDAVDSLAVYLLRSELLALLQAGLLEFLLIGFYALAVYRLMLLGEPLNSPKFSDLWLRRYLVFVVATFRAMLIPLLAFLPYAAFMALQIWWSWQGHAPDFIPERVLLSDGPTNFLRILGAVLFYILFARYVFVQPATAVDVPYSPRESWRVTNWVWGHMLIITIATLGSALLIILGVKSVWPVPLGSMGAVSLFFALFVSCLIWIIGITGFVVALSIAFCLRTGWRPGAQKLSIKQRPIPGRTAR